MNLLFVCEKNSVRSRTAEALYDGHGSIEAKSSGILSNSAVAITAQLVQWADILFVMEYDMKECIRENHPNAIGHREIVNLEIYDFYYFMQPELVKLIRKKVDPIVEDF